MTPYTLEFELKGLTKMANQLYRGSFWIKASHAKTWKRAVWAQVWHLRPPTPLEQAELMLTRLSSTEPDFDGLVSSFKNVIDGLVEHGVLANDKAKNIGQPEYKWEYAPRNKGKMKIKVTEVIGG